MTETHDLVTRLLAAIELAERHPWVPLAILRQDLIGQGGARIAQWVQPPETAREVAARIADAVMPEGATHITVDREAIRRRCAADRKIVRRYQKLVEIPTKSYAQCSALDAYRSVLYSLAEGYGLTEPEEGQP